MRVTIRPYVNGGWEVDIRVELPDGIDIRERKKAPTLSKTAAQRWAEAGYRVLVNGKPQPIAKGGADHSHLEGIRAAVPRGVRTGEPTEAQWHCREGVDPSSAPRSGTWQ